MINRYSHKELLFRLLFFAVGIAVTAVGASAFVLANTGTDSFGVLMQGIASLTGLSNGSAHISINLTFIVIIFFIDRKYIQIGTFVALFWTGLMIDLFTAVLTPLMIPTYPYLIRLVIVFLSCVLLGFGLSGVINAGVGTGANDIVSILISDKLHIQFRWIRIAVDVGYILIGWILGGVVGMGTIMCAVLIGPFAQFFMPYTAQFLNHFLRRTLGVQ